MPETAAEPVAAEAEQAPVPETAAEPEAAAEPVPAARPEAATEPEPVEAMAPEAEDAGPPEAEAAPAAAPVSAGADNVELSDPKPPSGGGGGGTPIPDPERPAAPDVSTLKPAAAMKAVAALPASVLSAALPSVGAAAQADVQADHDELNANPPSMQRPSGVPNDQDASLPPAPLPPLPASVDRSVPGMAGGAGAEPPLPVAPPAAPAPVTARVRDAVAGGDGQVSHEDAARVQGAVKDLPTSDPALYVDAGPVPELVLEGHEDPAQVDQQAGDVEQVTADTATEGLTDARAPMGENTVLPHVPDETLTATLPESGAAPDGKAANRPTATGTAAAGPDDASTVVAVDAIAAEKGADQIDGSTQSEGEALTTARTDHDTTVEDERAKTDKAINDEIAANGGEQTDTRRGVRLDVGAERKDWVKEQDDLTSKTRTAANDAQTQAHDTITDARTTARTDASTAIRDGNDNIKRERDKAEETAREKRKKAEEESDDGGFFSWIASKVKKFFNAIKERDPCGLRPGA